MSEAFFISNCAEQFYNKPLHKSSLFSLALVITKAWNCHKKDILMYILIYIYMIKIDKVSIAN